MDLIKTCKICKQQYTNYKLHKTEDIHKEASKCFRYLFKASLYLKNFFKS